MVSKDGAVGPDLVEHRNHLFTFREGAHWKKIQRITKTANGIKRSYVPHQALHKKKAHTEPKVLLLAAPMD